MIIPKPTKPEYRMIVVWNSEEDGPLIRIYLENHNPDGTIDDLMTSVHPNNHILVAIDHHLTEFFERQGR